MAPGAIKDRRPCSHHILVHTHRRLAISSSRQGREGPLMCNATYPIRRPYTRGNLARRREDENKGASRKVERPRNEEDDEDDDDDDGFAPFDGVTSGSRPAAAGRLPSTPTLGFPNWMYSYCTVYPTWHRTHLPCQGVNQGFEP
ncbi:uncharacterized protein GLRG_05093 [Colletotrichum graminicola M1.001]|uniref:Uncharacterized protein n=1 Tax=Colletotrichum graminicola (strain M1.001 / M2 / FGSC 10212) TaxID=645133 RepID=E3QGG1_COLGM|nr:uncharacterized protein GLRG_05093 [Colletotrichum graminicola M1.001]EFQ29949.1 hypothetical protein GLRG_05093 [Colletotrichum graminicola M1.001]